MRRYLAQTRRLAAATPAGRNRVVDFWRVLAILVVVCGHWLAVSVWVMPDGSQRFLNSLEWVPHAGWLTWVFQVMPVFFLAGGYANARGLSKVSSGDETPWAWVTHRARRLFTPVMPLLLLWVVLTLALGRLFSSSAMHTGAVIATMPIWFLAVYLALTALAPLTRAWWAKWGAWSLLTLGAAALLVDLLRFVWDLPGVGWANFAFVWALVHQVGYWWADREDRGGVPAWAGWPLGAGALGVLLLLTRLGWYPVAMVTIPGSGESNMTPPDCAIALLGMAQFGVIVGTLPAVRRLAARPRVWHAIVSFAGLAMTVFLWHLTAAMLTAAAGLSALGGAAFRPQPGTTLWWATRPLWFLVVGTLTLALVAVFAGFELGAPPARTPPAWAVLTGVVLATGSSAATALVYINTADARLGPAQWGILTAAVAGALLLRAFPARRPPQHLANRAERSGQPAEEITPNGLGPR